MVYALTALAISFIAGFFAGMYAAAFVLAESIERGWIDIDLDRWQKAAKQFRQEFIQEIKDLLK